LTLSAAPEESINDAWRQRLREAVKRSGRKHSDIAWAAGITPETLSRILNKRHGAPHLQTVTRIAHEIGVTVGWLLDEREFRIGASEREQLRQAAQVTLDLTRDDSP
jgi:transcriptional regulator with XRE-family HTH domain